MKSKCSFILKASTALVLALLMLFGTVTTSVAAVVDNAKTASEADAAEPEAHGAEGFFAMLRKHADLAETGATTYNLKYGTASGHSGWYDMPDTVTMTSSGTDHAAVVTLNANTEYWFHVKDSSGTYYKANWSVLSLDEETTLYNYGTNTGGGSPHQIKFTPSTAGKYTFTFDSSNLRLTVSSTNSTSIKLHYDLASGRDGYWELTDQGAMTNSSDNIYTKDVVLSASKYYLYTKVNSKFYKNPTALTTSSPVRLWYYSSNNADKVNFTPSSAGTYRFTWDNRYKQLSVAKVTYNVKKSESGTTGGTVTLGTTTLTTSDQAMNPGSYALSITAPSGYSVSAVSVSGGSLTTAGTTGSNTYSGTVNVSAATTVAVTYAAATTPSIDSVTISPSTLNIGGTATVSATTSNAGSATVSYSSSNTSVATVSGTTITAVSDGTATITASMTVNGTTYTKTATVTVNKPTITVSNKTGLKIGETYTPSPTLKNPSSTGSGWTVVYSRSSGTYSTTNGTTITGDIYNSNATTFKASYQYNDSEKASTTFTVKTADPTISMTSTAQSVNVGATYKRTATGGNIGSGATGTITYSSGTTAVATVASDGTVTAKTPGSSVITATYTVKIGSTVKATKTATYTVNVPTPGITQGNVTIAKGDNKTLSNATTNPSSGLTVTFALKSAVTGVTVNATSGKVEVAQTCSASSATVTITAKNSDNSVVATKDVTVTIATPSLDVKDGTTSVKDSSVYTTKGTDKQLTISSNFSDSLTAKSSNTSIATVALSGTTLTITPVAKGKCTVSVSTNSSYTPQAANLAETMSALPEGSFFRKTAELVLTGAVATQTVTFTVNVAEADTNKFITYATSSWTGTVYAWYNNAWHTMTKVGTDDNSRTVWAYNVGSSYPSTVVFSSQNSWNDGGNGLNQTVDCSASASTNSFYENGTSDGKRNVGSYATTITVPQLVVDNMTVQVDETKNLNVTVVNNTTPAKTTYTSANTAKATVTSAGAVTGVEPDGTTVTVRAWAAKPHSGWASWITDSTTQSLLSGTATSTITVTADPKSVTYRGKYSDNGTSWNDLSSSQGTFSVTNNGTSIGAANTAHSIAYNTTLTLTATPTSGYVVEGIYKSTDSGTTWTKITGSTLTVNDNYLLEARFIKVYKLSAFDSYEKPNNDVIFVTAPPKSIVIKHTDAHGTVTTYTYSYDGTKAEGNPDSPDVTGTKPAALPIATGTYGQGNYIQFYAGDEITMTYSAMASSELLKGVFYNNDTNFYVNKPTSSQFVAHDYAAAHTLYMNSAYYDSVPSSLPTTTVDQDAHSIKFTGTQDYKNIDVEIGTKRKVYFSDYKNTVIHSKNTDDYYYDNEALSVTGDQLTVAAAMSSTQTNKIVGSGVKFYKANADGTKGTELTSTEKTALGLSVTNATSTSTSSANGTALVISGNMPAYDLYIDLNMSNSYTLKAASKIVSDLGGSNKYLKQKATTVTVGTLAAPSNAYVSSGTIDVNTGSTVSLTVSGLTSGYMFVGWYWGDNSAPDYDDGFISDKQTLTYTPKKGGTIWAVGTKDLFINGSKYITGKSSDWYSESGSWKNQKMSFDPDRGEEGSYYWEITDTMFASAGSDFKYTSSNSSDTGGSNTEGKYFKGGDNYYYWCANDDSKHGKAFFQFIDTETGYDNREIWKGIYSFTETADGTTHGKILKRDMNQAGNTDDQRMNGQGFIDFAESRYTGYSSPLRIYYNAKTKDLDVEATPIYSNLYVSNGYSVGSTLKTDATTVTVPTGATSFTISTEGAGWNPDHEGHVAHYIPKKKGATVRITKEARGSDKIVAFLVYDIDKRTVRAEKNITAGTASGGKTPYYIDLTLDNVRQNLYIVPIVEESGATVTVNFDATQLNRAQWGDIVTAYAWYSGTNNPALGAYPGQPMIPSDDMSTWTTSFKPTEGSGTNELAGITFSNYVDGNHSWLGCSGVMGTVSDHSTGTASGGIINVYNHVDSGASGEYSRTNYKAQTYDYHEPIALYYRYKNEDTVNISFQMKDGNSSLISWRHHEFAPENIISGSWGSGLRWEYLTNAKGDKYIDMNGNPMDTKPSASFYVAAKGQVIYKDGTMKYVFHGGHNYEMKGYTGTYSDPTGGADRGSYARSALSSWNSDITYTPEGASSLSMNYGVQWYVYDAQGNYITTVLSAGISDLSSNNVDTYIGKELEDKGYAVDGKSVAICYDKPRYMYGDWSVTNSADNINSGPDFDAYRFEGQWIAAASTDTVKVSVEVAMMTDSGEVLAHSRSAGYGNAAASLVSGVTFGKPTFATVATDGAWAQTAATDAKLNGIELNASSQNFIGWYYYDANTEKFTKATYASNEDFRPNYTNKDVTFYAVYRASAVYQYKYTGREGARTYSAAGEDLTAAEMSNNSIINAASHVTDIKAKVPVGIGIFKKTIDFTPTNYDSWTKTPDNNGYVLDITGFATSLPTYTLTATYKKADGSLNTITKSAVYNEAAVNLTAENGGTAVTTAYGTADHKFLGWYAYDGGVKGDLLSTQANYGLRLTRDQAIIAVYEESDAALPTDGWSVHIDENEVNKELTTATTGVFYNDTIVRVRNGSDMKATLPSGAKIGVIVVTKPTGVEKEPNSYGDAQLLKLVDSTFSSYVSPGKTATTKSGLVITNMQASTQTSFNRTDIAVRSDYAKMNGSQYCVYAYFYDGSAYHFSAASAVKTYE